MTIVTPVTPANLALPAPSAFDQLLAAETAAWDAYEAALAVAQEVQDSFVSAGYEALKAYHAVQWRRNDACNALDVALAAAHADYEDARGGVKTKTDQHPTKPKEKEMTVINLAYGTTAVQVFRINIALDEAKRNDPFWANHEFAVSFDAYTSVEGDSLEAFILMDKILGILSPQYA